MKTRKRIFDIIQIGKKDDFLSRSFDFFIAAVIITNICVMFLETYDELAGYQQFFKGLEFTTLCIFCIEYIIRIWTADYLYPELSPTNARWRFLLSFDGIVDLLTILPFFFLSGFVAFRMLRVVRIFHLFRLNASYDSFNVITEVLYEKKNQIISSVFFIIILMLSSSLAMYSVEHDAQPEVFRNAFSCIWWSVSTVLTVGYGDIYPITTIGKIMAIIIAFLGVGVVAIPTGIISAGFVEQYTKINSISKERDIRFVTIQITENSSWYQKQVQELQLPSGLLLAVILRSGRSIIPHRDTILQAKDELILSGQNYKHEQHISLYEVVIDRTHPWKNNMIRDIDLSRQSLIAIIKRHDETVIPNGQTVIQEGDTIIMYHKKRL